jgi:thiol:disulfide interchange protein/DsbC/DsbD-like thiol-disulfide interchange protein
MSKRCRRSTGLAVCLCMRLDAIPKAAAILLASCVLFAPASSQAAPEVPAGASAETAAGGPDREPNARLALLVDRVQVAPGEPLRVGVLFDVTPGWHLYWRYPGQSGLPTEVEWKVADAAVGPIQWPAPHVFREDEGFITTYGYEDELLLASEVRFAPGTSGEREIGAAVDFLVCKIQCIPGRAQLARKVSVGVPSAAVDEDARELFDRYASQVPVSPESLGLRVEALYSQSAIRPGDVFKAAIAVVGCAAEGADPERCAEYGVDTAKGSDAFVPDRIPGIEVLATGARAHPFAENGSLITLEGKASPDQPTDAPLRLAGVLHLEGPDGPVFVDVRLALPVAAAGSAVASNDVPWLEAEASAATRALPILQALLLAFLGGLILNLMPCVFPVLAIKLSGIAELAHKGRTEVLAHGAAYTGGILLSMAGLAGIVLGLRAAGVAVGWGFQFQEPLFVLAVGCVLVAFALNLFGVFEISPDLTRVSRVGEHASGPSRSFFEGLLAVVLATPCSAPYLGTAVGFAFAASGLYVVAIFLTIGLGLALPFVVVTLIPGWARILPRPGMWMVHLRQVLGFALLAAAVWLLGILGGAAGSQAMVATAACWLAVGFVAWLYGALQHAGRLRAAGLTALVGTAVLVLGATALPLDGAPDVARGTVSESSTRAFEPAAIASELEQGKPVFVYFTADWCLTCKVNEKAVLDTPEVQDELSRLGFTVFRGDWTRRDERIRSELARFGRAAVPLYLVYDPAKPGEPQLLPEILSVDTFIAALRRAAPEEAPAARTAQGEAI